MIYICCCCCAYFVAVVVVVDVANYDDDVAVYPRNLLFKSLVKIGSVIDEMLHLLLLLFLLLLFLLLLIPQTYL